MNLNPRMLFMIFRLGTRVLRSLGGWGAVKQKFSSLTDRKPTAKSDLQNPAITQFWTHYAAHEIDVVEDFLDNAERDPQLDKMLEDIHEDVFYDMAGPDVRGTYTMNLLADGDASAIKAAHLIASAAPNLQMTQVAYKQL